MKRAVFVSDEAPAPGIAGHRAYNFAVLDFLRARGFDIRILLVRPRLDGFFTHPAFPTTARGARALAGRLIPLSPGTLARALPTPLKRRLKPSGGKTASLGRFIAPNEIAWCASRIAALEPGLLIIDTIFRAPLLDVSGPRGIPSLLLAHDLFHRRAAALREAGIACQPELDATAEAALLDRATIIAAIQAEERDAIAALCPTRASIAAPMPASPCPRPPGIARDPNRLVFLGSANAPNLDGLRWFFAEIWPALRAARPGLTLDLLGTSGHALGALPSGVAAHGIVPLAPFLHRAGAAIAPLRAGSGLKIKLLDYARHGLATIATPEALAGLAPDPAAPFIPASGAPQFAEAILRAPRVSEDAALAYVARHYASEQVLAPLLREVRAAFLKKSGAKNL